MKGIGSVKENLDTEKRISITPETVKKLAKLNFTVSGVMETLFSEARSSLTDPIIFIISVLLYISDFFYLLYKYALFF